MEKSPEPSSSASDRKVKYYLDHIQPWNSCAAAIALIAYFLYFGFRVNYIYRASIPRWTDLTSAYLYLMVECGLTVRYNIDRILNLFAYGQKPQLSKAIEVDDDDLPLIDVLIMCCGEDISVILDTVRATCGQDYPKSKYRVFVSDDGVSTALSSQISQLQQLGFDHLKYITRGKDHAADFKVGNLNFAAAFTDNYGREPSEFIAQLDADLIPVGSWLRTVASHILSDDKLGMVAPPQAFYNVPGGDSLWQLVFNSGLGPISASFGIGKSTGSGYLVRRQALKDVGGWPHLMSEDSALSLNLMAAGWSVSYIWGPPLQYGLLPTTFNSHNKQRTRWIVANAQLALEKGFWLTKKATGQMTLQQRFSAFRDAISPFGSIFLTIPLALLPLLLLTGSPIITFSSIDELRTLIRLAFFLAIAELLYDTAQQQDLRGVQKYLDQSFWQSPYYFATFLRWKILPKCLGGGDLVFSSSGSQESECLLRSESTKTTWSGFSRAIIQSTVKYHLLYFILLTIAILNNTYRAFTVCSAVVDIDGELEAEEIFIGFSLFPLLTSVFWPPLIWYAPLRMSLLPLWYMLSPADHPKPEDLLERNEVTRLVFPKREVLYPKIQSRGYWGAEYHRFIAMSFTTVVFVLSFYI